MSLFDASLLGEASALSSGSLVLRPLCRSDGKRGFVRVLSQLTTVGNYSESQFEQRFDQMCAVNAVFGTYFIVVVEDKTSGHVMGAASLVVEQKFIRDASLCGHIEDVVTDKQLRGKGMGKMLIDTLVVLARRLKCYKVILDCSDDNVPFYERCGFKVKEKQMVIYLNQQSKL